MSTTSASRRWRNGSSGACAAEPVVDPETGEIIIDKDEIYTEETGRRAWTQLGVDDVYVFSPMTCELRQGICAEVLRPRPGTR